MNLNFLHDQLIRGTRLNAKEIIPALLWSPDLKLSLDLEQISQPLHFCYFYWQMGIRVYWSLVVHYAVKSLKTCKPPFPSSWAFKHAQKSARSDP